jgi:hypothetical protein
MADRKDLIPLENANCWLNRTLLVHGSAEWTTARYDLVCASEIASLLGLDDQRSRGKLLDAKKNRCMPPMSVTGENMCNLGKAYEPVALYQAQDFFAYPITQLGSLRSVKVPEFEGEPDGVTLANDTNKWIPIEVKTRAYPNPWDATPYESVFDVPNKHWIQLQSYMLLLDSPYGYLISFSPTNGLRIFKQNRSYLLEDIILGCAHDMILQILPRRVSTKDKGIVLKTLDRVVREETFEVVYHQAFDFSTFY